MLRFSRRLPVIVAIALAAVAWVYAARALMHPAPVTSTQAVKQPAAIVWAGRVFSSRAALSSWLSAHGTSYRAWAKSHPVAAATIEHRAAPAGGALTPPVVTAPAKASSQSGAPGVAAKASPQSAAPRVAAQATSPSSGSSGSVPWARFVLLALSAMVMLSAAVPVAFVRVLGPNWLSTTPRAYAFALGLSVCVGVLVAGHL